MAEAERMPPAYGDGRALIAQAWIPVFIVARVSGTLAIALQHERIKDGRMIRLIKPAPAC
jgi:hypothetical protein